MTFWPHHHDHEMRRQAVDRPVSFTYEAGSPSPRIEPVTLDLVKQQVRYLTTDEDDLLNLYIATARAFFEEQSGRQIIDATWEYGMRCPPWSRSIELPRPPLAGDVVIAYDDADGDAQTFDADNYTVEPSFLDDDTPPAIDPHCAPGSIRLVVGASWPVTSGEPRSFRIRRTCGYGADTADVPPIIQSALCLLIAHLHRNRSEIEGGVRQGFETLPLGAQTLIQAFKWTALPTTTLR